MMIRVSSPKACEIRGISHKQKRKDQKMKKHSKHSGFFLVSLRDVVSIAKQSTRFVRREGSLRSGYLGPQRLKHYNVTDFSVCRAFNSPSATGVFILGVNDFFLRSSAGSGLFRFPFLRCLPVNRLGEFVRRRGQRIHQFFDPVEPVPAAMCQRPARAELSGGFR